MKILVISDVNINDLVSLNIIQNELIASNEQEVIDFDLVFIVSHQLFHEHALFH